MPIPPLSPKIFATQSRIIRVDQSVKSDECFNNGEMARPRRMKACEESVRDAHWEIRREYQIGRTTTNLYRSVSPTSGFKRPEDRRPCRDDTLTPKLGGVDDASCAFRNAEKLCGYTGLANSGRLRIEEKRNHEDPIYHQLDERIPRQRPRRPRYSRWRMHSRGGLVRFQSEGTTCVDNENIPLRKESGESTQVLMLRVGVDPVRYQQATGVGARPAGLKFRWEVEGGRTPSRNKLANDR